MDPTKRIPLHKSIFKADYETEKKIYDWIIFNRSLGNMIITWAVAIEFIKADIKYKNYKPKSLFMKVYRFLKRFNLSIRAGTHIGQQLPQDSKDLILKFLHKVITIRKTYNINKENIINVDETALSYNMPFNKTIHKCGAKTICIRTQRQEKCRISILLSIAGDGNKLMPYAIFKGAANGKIINILNKSKYVTEKRCICQANKNAWSCNSIIIDWINKVYIPYFTVKNVELNNTLLIWDQAPMHYSYDIQKYLSLKKINFIFILAGLTGILQPLDVCINKPFKEIIKRNYEELIQSFKLDKIPKIKRETLIKWIVETWEIGIKKELVEKSFLVCGISNNMDGSEDDLFIGYDKTNELGFVENDFTKEDMEDMNNNVSIDSSSISEEGSSDDEIKNE